MHHLIAHRRVARKAMRAHMHLGDVYVTCSRGNGRGFARGQVWCTRDTLALGGELGQHEQVALLHRRGCALLRLQSGVR